MICEKLNDEIYLELHFNNIIMILYNAYNILWLDTSSTQKEITKRWKDILKYLAIWEVPFFDNDLDLIEEYRNKVYIKESIDNLSNPKERLINSFFWFEIEDEEDKKIFNLINKKKFIWAISLVEKSKNKKNLAILYSLILLDKDLENIKINDTPIVLAEKLINIFKELWENKWFWKLFEKKFFLHDDLSTDKKILEDFKSNLWVYLSDLFHDISKNIWNDEVLKIFNKTFSNIKWNKTNKEVDIVYLKLTEIVKRLEWMDISEDWIFDDDEKSELKNIYREINSLLNKFKDIWLYDDSKTILIRDNLVNALRVIILDLSNVLKDYEEALNILKLALKIVWTAWLKHKINEEYAILTDNIKNTTKPVKAKTVKSKPVKNEEVENEPIWKQWYPWWWIIFFILMFIGFVFGSNEKVTCWSNQYSSWWKCYCDSWYELEWNSCVKDVRCWSNQYSSWWKCYCDSWYKVVWGSCIKEVTCWSNQSLLWWKCYCKSWYKLEWSSCVKKVTCWTNTYESWWKCYCYSWYTPNW